MCLTARQQFDETCQRASFSMLMVDNLMALITTTEREEKKIIKKKNNDDDDHDNNNNNIINSKVSCTLRAYRQRDEKCVQRPNNG